MYLNPRVSTHPSPDRYPRRNALTHSREARIISGGICLFLALGPKFLLKKRARMFEPAHTFVAVPVSSIQVFREKSSSISFLARSIRDFSCRPKAKYNFPLSPLAPVPM